MIEYSDGSVLAQVCATDMRMPIQYALTYPERRSGRARLLDITNRFALHFEPPDPARFPALRLAYDVARLGGTAGAVLNAANEAAVAAFSAGEIPFGQISRLVELTIDRHRVRLQQNPSLSDLLDADQWARETVRGAIDAAVGERPAIASHWPASN